MMPKQTPSAAEHLLYVTLIVLSAAFILVPAVRAMPVAKLVVGLMIFALLALWIWRDRKNGHHKLSVPEIFSKARRGHSFAPRALESAATVATLVAFWLTI